MGRRRRLRRGDKQEGAITIAKIVDGGERKEAENHRGEHETQAASAHLVSGGGRIRLVGSVEGNRDRWRRSLWRLGRGRDFAVKPNQLLTHEGALAVEFG